MTTNKFSKSDLIKEIKRSHPEFTNSTIETIVCEMFSTMSNALADDKIVSIFGFGTFKVKNIDSYKGYDPYTKKMTMIPKSKRVRFHSGSSLKQLLKDKSTI